MGSSELSARGVTDGLASHPGGRGIYLVSYCYGIQQTLCCYAFKIISKIK